MSEQRRFIIFGAHPDDCDTLFGGTATKLVRAGHIVKFVSVCNGDCGHMSMDRRELAKRRYQEAQNVKALAGLVEYQVLDHHDCEIVADLALREEIIRIIRRFEPDVVLSHRSCDYHADHRNTGQAVMDAAYLVKVPLYCKDTPIPKKNPVFAYTYDRFQDPRPIRPDAVVEVDSVLEDKFKLLDCHVSQYYEWLPWDSGLDKECKVASLPWKERYPWLLAFKGQRFIDCANIGREQLRKVYGAAGDKVKYAELFEFSPYGESISKDDFQKLFL